MAEASGRRVRPPSALRAVTVAALVAVLGLVGVNAARQEWTLALGGLFLATGILHLLALLPRIEDR